MRGVKSEGSNHRSLTDMIKDEPTARISFGSVVLVVLLTGVGYLFGHERIIGRAIENLRNLTSSSNYVDLAPIPDKLLQEELLSESYTSLNQFLDQKLRDGLQNNSEWTQLLESVDFPQANSLAALLKSKVARSLGPWPPKPSIFKTSRELLLRRNGISISLLKIDFEDGISLPILLIVPQNEIARKPAILALHGMYGTAQSLIADIDYHHGFAYNLAKEGFIVLAPLRTGATIETRNTLYAKAQAAGLSLEALELRLLQSCLDYLTTLETVNSDAVGVYGISLGGQHALWLAALDERVSCVVVSQYFANRFSWLFRRSDGLATAAPTDEMTETILAQDTVLYLNDMGSLLSDLNSIALIQPRYLAIVSGTKNPRFTSAQAEFSYVSKIYKNSGAPAHAAFISFEGNHETSLGSVVPFLRQCLGKPSP